MRFTTWWRRHGVAIFGYLSAAIPALLGIKDLIPPEHQKYWLAVAVLTGIAIAKFSYSNQKPQGPKS